MKKKTLIFYPLYLRCQIKKEKLFPPEKNVDAADGCQTSHTTIIHFLIGMFDTLKTVTPSYSKECPYPEIF